MSDSHLTFDSVVDLCRNQHRRIVLGILAAEQRSVTLTDLTQAVLKYSHQIPHTEASEDVLAKIRNSFHHHHLPKLTSEGLVTYEPDRGLVAATEQFEKVQPTVSAILDADPELDAPIEL